MSDVKQSKALKIDQQILDKFWKLSESESSGIVKATDQLVVLLQKKEHHKNVENVRMKLILFLPASPTLKADPCGLF